MTFDIRFFGAIEIRHNGTLLTGFRSQKALVLLAYLLCEERALPREYLAGLGWPESDQSQALGLLRRSLHDLNSQLPGCLDLDRRTVRFQLDAPVAIDVQQFRTLAAQADVESWAAAAALYRAPFLQGIYVDDAPELESWLLREQERWQGEMIRLLLRLADYQTENGDYARALHYTQQLLALEPWREEAHRQAMILLARTGQVSAALAQYESCRRALQAELDVEPAHETKMLRARLAAIAQLPTPSLPAATTPFIGRSAQLAELAQLLANRNCRLITLLGPGGMGKTRLALETARGVATAQQRRFLHGVHFVPLVGVATLPQLVAALGHALAFPFQPQSAPESQLLHYLHDKELLLVLDNFEQLVNEAVAAFVRQLLDRAPDLKLLITSRVRLHLQGEQLYWMQGLAVPITTRSANPSVAEVATYSSVQLFLATVQRSQPSYSLSAADVAAVTTICQLVQGMPLALELAAAWISVLTPAEIAAELTRNLDFLASDAHDLPLRQRSMRAVFETSWRLLTAAEQRVFQQLSVFRGSFTRQAVQAVTGASLSDLMGLINKSFLQQILNDRYQIHDLLRQLTVEKLLQNQELNARAHQAHANYYGDLLAVQATGPNEEQVLRTLQTIKEEYDNLSAAWITLSTQQTVTTLDAAINAFYFYHDTQCWYTEGIKLFSFTLTQFGDLTVWKLPAERVDGTEHAVVVLVTRLLNRLARFYFYNGNYPKTEELLTVALALAQDSGQESEVAFALARMGHLASSKGEPSKASDYHERSLILYQQLGDNTEIARQFNYLGVVAHNSGRLVEAWQLYEQGHAVAKGNNNPSMLSMILYNFGKVGQELGRYDEAQAYLQKSLHYQQILDDQEGIGYVLHGMAHVLMNRGEYVVAQQQAHQALNIFQQIRYPHGIVFTLCIKGELHGYLCQYDEAFHCLHEGLVLAQQGNLQHDEALILLVLGRLHLTKGELSQAQQAAQTALQLSVETDAESIECEAYILLGEIINAVGDKQTAYTHLQQALKIGCKIETPPLQLKTLFAIALLLHRSQSTQSIIIATVVAKHSATVAITKERSSMLLLEMGDSLPAADFQRAHDYGNRLPLATLIEEVTALISPFSSEHPYKNSCW